MANEEGEASELISISSWSERGDSEETRTKELLQQVNSKLRLGSRMVMILGAVMLRPASDGVLCREWESVGGEGESPGGEEFGVGMPTGG